MHKARLYILQGLGIIMLIFGYLLSDKPDSLSVMHFNLQGNHVFSSASEDEDEIQFVSETTISEHKSHHHKLRVIKLFSLKAISAIPVCEIHNYPTLVTNYRVPLNESYHFLFCKEINPPPPKAI